MTAFFESVIYSCLPYVLDVFGIWLYFCDVENQERGRSQKWILTCVCWLILLPQYAFSAKIPSLFVRFFTRLICAFMFQLINKKVGKISALYNALSYHICYTACLIITMTPVFAPWKTAMSVELFGNAQFSMPIGLSISSVLFYLFIMIKHVVIGQAKQMRPDFGAFIMVVFLNLVQQILKYLHRNIDVQTANTPVQLTVYALIAQLSIVLVHILLERYFYTKEMNRIAELVDQATEYKQQNIDDTASAISLIAKTSHDMRNHFVVLRSMTDNGQIVQYIDSLLEQTSPIYEMIHTGNQTIDAILNAKAKTAKERVIRLAAQVEGHLFDFISDVDLCSIWGNALDNAIEACENVNEEDRVIHIATRKIANQVILKIENPYMNKMQFVNGFPLTTKSDKSSHGIGLLSIRQAAEKYNGTVVVSTEEGKKFVLTAMFPVPEKNDILV